MKQAQESIDVYALVTNQIISQLEQKIVPWQQPWTSSGIPQNLISRNPYRGVNLWLLVSLGYEHNVFITWKQLKVIGGSVNKGEKGQYVVFWKTFEKEHAQEGNQEEQTKKSVLRYYKVFNIAQCSNIPAHFIPPIENQIFSPIAECERIIEDMPQAPLIVNDEEEAYYDPKRDIINMPKPKHFKHTEQYYSVLFHELVHSTGHESRLKRKEITEKTNFASKQYSIEELTAEIGACYLNSLTGIGNTHFKQNVAYINGWLEALKKDNRLIIYASSKGQQAVDFIRNIPLLS